MSGWSTSVRYGRHYGRIQRGLESPAINQSEMSDARRHDQRRSTSPTPIFDTMVRDTLSAFDLQDVEPDELLNRGLRDDRVLRLVEDAVRIKRSHISQWMGVEATSELATIDPDAPANDVVEVLARVGFTANWLLSYEYVGEKVNLVMFHYDDEEYPELPWRQTHVRIFEDGMLEAHEEASALMHKGPHTREETFDRERGTKTVAGILGDAGLEYDLLL